MGIRNLAGVAGLMVTIAGGASAQDARYTTGVVINADGWALVHADHVVGCTALDLPGIGDVAEVIADDANGIAAIRVATGLLGAGAPIATSVPDTNANVVVLGHRRAARQSDVSGLVGRVVSTFGEDGNSTRFAISIRDTARLAAPAVFDTQGRLSGIALADRQIGGGEARVLSAPFLSLFLDSRGIGWTAGRWQARPASADAVFASVSDHIVRVRCRTGAPTPPVSTAGVERAAMDFLAAYFDAYSSPNATAVADLRARYARNIVYFGAIQGRAAVMADKQRFFETWPIRHYALRPGLLDISCRSTQCEANGEIAFIDHAPARNAVRQGVASFRMLIDTRAGRILEENSQLLTRGPVDTGPIVTAWVDRALACRADSSTCAARDHTEMVLAVRDLCVRARRARPSAADIGPCNQTPPAGSDQRIEAEGAADFINGAEIVEAAHFGQVALPASGVLEMHVQGRIRNFDPGTPGVARFALMIGDTELPFDTELALPNGQETDYALSLRLTLSRADLPTGNVPVRVIYRTNRRSIHTAHDSFAELEIRP